MLSQIYSLHNIISVYLTQHEINETWRIQAFGRNDYIIGYHVTTLFIPTKSVGTPDASISVFNQLGFSVLGQQSAFIPE